MKTWRAYKVVQFMAEIEAETYEEAYEIAESMGHSAFDDDVEIELQVDEVEELL